MHINLSLFLLYTSIGASGLCRGSYGGSSCPRSLPLPSIALQTCGITRKFYESAVRWGTEGGARGSWTALRVPGKSPSFIARFNLNPNLSLSPSSTSASTGTSPSTSTDNINAVCLFRSSATSSQHHPTSTGAFRIRHNLHSNS